MSNNTHVASSTQLTNINLGQNVINSLTREGYKTIADLQTNVDYTLLAAIDKVTAAKIQTMIVEATLADREEAVAHNDAIIKQHKIDLENAVETMAVVIGINAQVGGQEIGTKSKGHDRKDGFRQKLVDKMIASAIKDAIKESKHINDIKELAIALGWNEYAIETENINSEHFKTEMLEKLDATRQYEQELRNIADALRAEVEQDDDDSTTEKFSLDTLKEVIESTFKSTLIRDELAVGDNGKLQTILFDNISKTIDTNKAHNQSVEAEGEKSKKKARKCVANVLHNLLAYKKGDAALKMIAGEMVSPFTIYDRTSGKRHPLYKEFTKGIALEGLSDQDIQDALTNVLNSIIYPLIKRVPELSIYKREPAIDSNVKITKMGIAFGGIDLPHTNKPYKGMFSVIDGPAKVAKFNKVKNNGLVPKSTKTITEAIKYMQHPESAIRLAMSEEDFVQTMSMSAEMTTNSKWKSNAEMVKVTLDNARSIIAEFKAGSLNLDKLKESFTQEMILDLIGRMYNSANKLSTFHMQGKGKMNFVSAVKRLLNSKGMKHLRGALVFTGTDEKRTAKAFEEKWLELGFDKIKEEILNRPRPEQLKEFVWTGLSEEEVRKNIQENYIEDPEKTDKENKKLAKEAEDNAVLALWEEKHDQWVSDYAKQGKKLSEWLYNRRLVQAYQDGLDGVPTDFILLKDFAASGLLMWATNLKLPKLAKFANLLCEDTGVYSDPYTAIVQELATILGLGELDKDNLKAIRDGIKEALQAILHGGFFTTAEASLVALNLGFDTKFKKNKSGRGTNGKVLEAAFVKMFGEGILAIRKMTKFGQDIATEQKPHQAWTSMDGFVCQNANTGAKTKYKTYFVDLDTKRKYHAINMEQRVGFSRDVKGNPKTGSESYNIYGVKSVARGKTNGFAANLLHSFDAIIARAIATALQGRLYIFVHDNYGTHPNDMDIVEATTRKYLKIFTDKNLIENALDDITRLANKGYQDFVNIAVKTKATKEWEAICLENSTKFRQSDVKFEDQPYQEVDWRDASKKGFVLNLGDLKHTDIATDHTMYVQY